MDKNTVSINNTSELRLVSASNTDLAHIRTWFTNKRDLLMWGGPAMQDCANLTSFVSELVQNNFVSYSLMNKQELVGFGQLQAHSKQRIHLGRLAIRPNKRGSGLSHILLTQLLALAEKKFQSTQASLFVYQTNTFALHTYMKNGFKTAVPPKGMRIMSGCDYMLKQF